MFVPHKPHPFGNKYHTIARDKAKVIYIVDIVEGTDKPRVMGKKEFDKKGETAGLTVRITKPLWGTGKVVVIYRGFCLPEGLISMVEKGVFGSALTKKRSYWPNGVPEEEILWHMQKKEVGDVTRFKVQ